MTRPWRERAWVGALVAGAVSVFVFLSAPQQSVLQVCSFFAPLVLGVGLLFARVKDSSPSTHGPLRLLFCAQLAYLVTTLIWYLGPFVLGRALPFPSFVDVMYFTVYGSYAAFLLMVLRRRSHDRIAEGQVALTDALILTVSMSALLWVLIIEPTTDNATSLMSTTVGMLYPGFTVLLFALGARLAIGSGVGRSSAGALLLLWIGCEIVGDILYGYESANGSFEYGERGSVAWILAYTSLAALAAHPATVRLLSESTQTTTTTATALGDAPGGLSRSIRLAVPLSAAVLTLLLATTGERSTVLLVAALFAVTLVVYRTSLLAGHLHDERQLRVALDDALTELRTQRGQLAKQALELERLVLHDSVTGLGNRALLRQRAATVGQRLGETSLLLLDLDGFKEINDTLGHAAGDDVLLQVGNRIGGCVRTEDTVVRLGGDEFGLLLVGTGRLSASLAADRVLAVLREPFLLDGLAVRVQGSIGIATGGSTPDLDELLCNADLAMYGAKAAGRDQACMFDPRMHEHVARRREAEADVRAAIDVSEFTVHYQPIVNAASGEVSSVEALVRWEHPVRGLLPPIEFLPAAERTGLIVELGRFVLRTACAQLAEWRQDWPSLCVAVNVSQQELLDPGFAAEVQTALDHAGLPADALHLEITETILAAEENISHILEPLAALGVRFSIDDFGTGHSSLSRLRRLRAGRLKIDQSFIAEISEGETDSAPLLASIIAMAHSVGHVVVAEGVETRQQAAFLTAHRCDELQGYFFSRPVAPGQIISALLTTGTTTSGGLGRRPSYTSASEPG